METSGIGGMETLRSVGNRRRLVENWHGEVELIVETGGGGLETVEGETETDMDG